MSKSMKIIAIQGIKGSFHHIVANKYFGEDITLNECLTFDEMPNMLIEKKVDYLIMAIENSIAGAILANYKLIDQFNLNIVGEYYLPIEHQLMALENQNLSQIKEIWSHPMAINQCRKFLRKHPNIKLIESEDTAVVAKNIQENNLNGIAAIAGKLAAKLYNLSILEANIHTNPQNYTRFFILDTNSYKKDTFNKVSLKIITKHQMGSLSEVLQIFVNNRINLTKIQSLPIENVPWEYAFFVDVIFEETSNFYNAKTQFEANQIQVKILGKYNDMKKNGYTTNLIE